MKLFRSNGLAVDYCLVSLVADKLPSVSDFAVNQDLGPFVLTMYAIKA